VAELDGLVYVVGGIRGNRTVAATVEAYDPKRDAWRSVAPLPQALHHVAVAAVDGKLYAAGGYRAPGLTPVNTLYAYDPETDQWTRRADLPDARGGLAAAVIGDKLYAVGGARGRSLADAAAYDPETDHWETLPPMPTARDHLGAVGIDGTLYAVGGRNQRDTLGTLEAFDPKAESWQRLVEMPTGRSGVAAAPLGGCLYVFGGEGNRMRLDGVFPQVERYDPASNTWETLLPMPHPRHGIGAAVVGGRIHVPGGGPVQGFGVTEVHDALRPTSACP